MSFLGSLNKRSKKGSDSEAAYTQSIRPQRENGASNLGGRYDVYGELGQGGFGIVYKVYCHETTEVYALKTFKDDFLDDGETRKLFIREANVWIALERHPYLVQARFVDEISGRLYIAMEYIAPNEQGLNTLEGYLEYQPPDLDQSLRWAIQFCHGMEYAYSKGLRCHRDIKPANIMITSEKNVKISDFGLAGVLSTSSRKRLIVKQGGVGLSNSIMDGKGCGTPTHMPPEQFTNAATCDQRSDIYAFGVVLYQLATGGKLPFLAVPPRDNSEEEQVRFSREMYQLHSHAPVQQMDSPLFPAIHHCLEKNKNKRYASFRELRAELEPLLKRQTGETVKSPELMQLNVLELINKGFSLNSLGYFQEAINCCDEALKINSLLALAWLNKSVGLDGLRRYAEAIKCCDKALEINPQDARPWINKGHSLNGLRRYAEAAKCFDRALEINPQDTNAWNNKGNNLNDLGNYAEAVKCFDRALEINPQNIPAWINKGLSLDRLGYFQEGIICYDKALEINPQDTNAWINKGFSLNKLSRYDEAIACCDKILEIDPQHADAGGTKCSILANMGHYNEAMMCCDKTLENNPQNVGVWATKGFSLDSLGRFREAKKCYDTALEINPQYSIAWYNKGVLLDRSGHINDAIKHYDRALASDPKFADAWNNKGLCLKRLGHLNEALECYDKALEINPRHLLVWCNKGTVLYKMGKNVEAIVCYDKALEINPQDVDAWNNKAMAEEKLGQKTEASRSLRKFIQLLAAQDTVKIENARQRLRELERR